MARKARTWTKGEVSTLARETAQTDRAAAMAFFLLDNGTGIYGTWKGTLTASEQRALFGRFIGKGLLYVDGARETVEMTLSADFTGMRATEVFQPWFAIAGGYIERRLGVGFDNRAKEAF